MASLRSEFEPTEQDLEHIREWLNKTPHIVQDHDEDVVRALIIACKGSLQKTKRCYEKLNRLGFTYPYLFGHLDPVNESTQYFLNNAYLFLMPEKSDDGSMILIASSRENEIDSTKFSVLEIPRYIYMSFLVLLWENNLGASKFTFVCDYKNSKLSELKSATPMFLKDFTSFLFTLPIRFQGSHNVRVPSFILPIVTVVNSAVGGKLAKRIHFHKSMDELYEKVPKKYLPKEFGGYGEDLNTLHNRWKEKVESYRGRLISENRKMRKLDYLRPKANGIGELQGSFRKLEVD